YRRTRRNDGHFPPFSLWGERTICTNESARMPADNFLVSRRQRAPALAAPPRPAALTPQDQADVKRVQDYLNGIHTLQSRFQQFSPEGGVSAGTIYLQRPGKMRIVYDEPV